MAVRSPVPTHPSPDRTTLTPTSSPSPLHLHSCPVLAIAPAPGLGPHFLTPQAHPIFTRPTLPSPGALDYADYDEATRLEAEASLYTGSAAARRECASSDPLGEEERLTRVRQLR